jgi:mannose-binding lectin 1
LAEGNANQYTQKPNLRAYLNDGKTQYTKHHDPPSLAFASCEYNYRNKPHASKLTLSHSAKNKHLRVELDGVVCIDTDKARIYPHVRI